MEKSKILYVSQEIHPYLPESAMSNIARNLPQAIQEREREIRTFMPRFGCVNERRHQLHEVIRLSGMNLIVNDLDHPLIIKVASIQQARMQVYFIDNEEYFKRKAVFHDKETSEFFEDNDERMIFFCRGVIETVKKLGWAPDVIHCHGWMASLLPMYIKTMYKNDPLFTESKIVYSIYDEEFNGELDKELAQKAVTDYVDESVLKPVSEPTLKNLYKFAASYSDGVIIGDNKVNKTIVDEVKKLDIPMIEHPHGQEEYVDVYSEFYDSILENDAVLAE